MMTNELAPCPFCGSEAKLFSRNLIGCSKTVECGATIDLGASFMTLEHDAVVKVLTEQWNSRSQTQEAVAEVCSTAKGDNGWLIVCDTTMLINQSRDPKLKRGDKLYTSQPNDKAEIARLREALERIASSEAFDFSRALHKENDAELIARMKYARDALAMKGE